MVDYGYGVELTRIDPDDSDLIGTIFQWRNDPRIYKWCRQRSPLHWHDHNRWVASQASDVRISMFVICNDISDAVGVCGFTDVDHINRRAEFSCYIGPAYWRRGYATAALLTLFRHGFEDYGFNIIWGETFDGNPAYNLFTYLGMVHEGTRRSFYYKEGSWIDAHLLSITKSEFSTTLVKRQGAYDGDRDS